MKTSVPNQFINQQNNVLLFRNPLNLMMKRLLLLIVFAIYGGTITAQESRAIDRSTSVMEVRSYISTLRNQQNSRNSAAVAPLRVENLLYKVQPSVYFYAGVVKTYGETPRDLFTDFQSLTRLNNPAIMKNSIELVTIKVNAANLNSTIDWSVFSDFPSLKYIYIVSSVSTTEAVISRMAGTYDEKYSVFYKVDKGENNQ